MKLMKKFQNNLIKDKEVIQMTEEKKNSMTEDQTDKIMQKTQSTEEKIDTVKATLTTENSKMLSDDVIIEIVHAFKDIIIEFIHRKYQMPSK